MQTFIVVFLLGVVLALVWGGRRQDGRIIVVPQYISQPSQPERRSRGGLLWALLFAFILGAALAVWPHWDSRLSDTGRSFAAPTSAVRATPAPLIGSAMPVR